MNKPNKKPKSPEQNLQAVRDQVTLDELKARHWRAQYETAHYHMLFDKLLPDYTAFLEKLQKEREEQEKQQEEYIKQFQKEVEEGSLKDKGLNIEEVETKGQVLGNGSTEAPKWSGPGVYADGSQGGA